MKTIFFSIVMISVCSTAKSQIFVNRVNINQLDSVRFIELVGWNNSYSDSYKRNSLRFSRAVIDYGQKFIFNEVQVIQDAKGNVKTFRSWMDAVNFMTSNGWDFVQAYSASNNWLRSTSVTLHHYVF